MWVLGINRKTKGKLLALVGLMVILVIARFGLGEEDAELVTGHLRAVESVETEDRVVALTFDVSWGETIPFQVLDALKKHEVKCTFFISGPWANSHPDAVKRIREEGHEIGSHGYRHIRLSRYTRQVIEEEITKAHEILHATSGEEPKLFRPPDGDLNDTVISTALDKGYITVLWSLDSTDLKRPGSEFIVNRILKRAESGDIILFHASDSSPDTPQALPAIIEGLREAGMEIVTVSQLLERTDQ